MARRQYFVSPEGANWKLTHNGSVLARDANKAPIIAVGRVKAKGDQPSELIIQNADGTIAERETYGNDPFPPRG